MMKVDRSHDLLNLADKLGHEARADDEAHAALRLWLRLLACTTQVETEIRRRLRTTFGISLARFDYMAQLYRKPEGMRMKELSRCLMVTGGNVTGLTDELEREKLVERSADPADGRANVVKLTKSGRRAFQDMATAHEGWIIELMGDLEDRAIKQLYEHLGTLRVQLLKDVSARGNVLPLD
ncbi:MarR family winged helix-turn-helix transcriptional regulator [Azohydromonas lata]|uniref:MarR family transcriptional regulator n=1 Tax=Azohydromonas lata TaxID=45677 RepID=A0ABU5IRG8_9BURK|nr:MarR family transcriptional regulator [Azohydromonas lata]MDZ5461476.1 MarR family transcriptional regulator [Azohydromonas lata]